MGTRVGVLGLGTMGSQISIWFACEGFAVRAWDIQLGASLPRVLRKIAMANARSRGLKKKDALEAVQRVEIVRDFAAVRDCEFVFEAVKEDSAVKGELISRLGEGGAAQPVVASNTSSIPISLLAAAASDPSRVVGAHFFNPVSSIALVELIPAKTTSDETVSAVHDLLSRAGKAPLLVPDIPGFVVNRLIFSMIREAFQLLQTGEIEAEAIDKALRSCTGSRLGPLETADYIGLDVCLDIFRSLHATTGDAKWKPPSILESMVAKALLGRKTGRGVYR